MLTRANIETVLLQRCRRFLTAAKLDATTADGTNADLVDPIGWALRQCDIVPALFGTVTNTDVARLDLARLDQLLDLAELRTLETIVQSLPLTDLEVGPRKEKFSQLVTQVERAIARKRAAVQAAYGTVADSGVDVAAPSTSVPTIASW